MTGLIPQTVWSCEQRVDFQRKIAKKKVLIKAFLISQLCQNQLFLIFLWEQKQSFLKALKVAESTLGWKEVGGCSLLGGGGAQQSAGLRHKKCVCMCVGVTHTQTQQNIIFIALEFELWEQEARL